MQRTMRALLGDIPGGQEKQHAARLATLTMRTGMGRRVEWLPVVAQNAVNVLDGDANVDGCLGVRQGAAGLDGHGFIGRPQGSLQMGTNRLRTW